MPSWVSWKRARAMQLAVQLENCDRDDAQDIVRLTGELLNLWWIDEKKEDKPSED